MQTMDTSAHGQRKGPYRESGFERYADLRVKRTPQRPDSPEICPSDFFLSGWLKGKLQRQRFMDPDQFREAIDEIFSFVSVDMIEAVFGSWIHQLVQVIASDGDSFQ
jgi:hypothetical protein